MKLLGLAAALLCASSPLAAQTADVADTVVLPEPVAHRASPPLPVDHWAARAALRAREMGWAPSYFPAQRSVPRAAVAAALAESARNAEDPRARALTRGWTDRFAEEFPEFAGARVLSGGRVGIRVEDERGRVEPAFGLLGARRDPYRRPDRSELAATATVAATLGPLAAVAEPVVGDDGARIPLWDVSADAGPISFAFGRQPVGYGPVRGGAIVMSGSVPLVRAQIQTARPVRLPSLLGYLGPVTFHTAVTRLEEPRHPGAPFMWTAHAGFRPHPRFDVGITRASIFGGDSVDTPVTVGNVARMFLGLLTDEFENQEVALDLRWRLPSESIIPATAYMEWGAEDASGSWWRIPGHTFGLLLPAIPAAPTVALGAEYTRFFTHCCGNPPWYLHAGQRGGFVYRGEPFGHPLGGEGWEALAYGQAELFDARLRLDARAFARNHSDEGLRPPQLAGNVFAPIRVGHSLGGSVDAAWRFTKRLEGRASLLRDDGDGWREQRFRTELSYLF